MFKGKTSSMPRFLIFFLIVLSPVLLISQVVDRIKSSSDQYESIRTEEYQNPTTTYYNLQNRSFAPVNSGTGFPNNSNTNFPSRGIEQFGASNSNLIYPTNTSNPEDDYLAPSNRIKEKEAGLQPESSWALRKEQIAALEEEELDAYLMEESKRGRHRRLFAEFRAQSGLRTDYAILQPRGEVGYGVFSTDLRMNQIIELGSTYLATYRTWDWQVLKVRLIDWQHCSLTFGGGMLFEQYSNEIFGEMTVEPEFNFFEGRLFIPIEWRMAVDSDVIIRTEISGTGNWLIHGGVHDSIFLSAGYVYQNYFQEVQTNGFVLGIHCRFF